jgi:uncharacterized protein
VEGYLNFNLIWALLCLSSLIISLGLNAVGVPGNWVIVIIAWIYSWLMPSDSPYAFSLLVVIWVCFLAAVGEIFEFFTGVLGTKKAGGSKKGMWCSVIGSIVGSFGGIMVGIPVPIIGSLIAALLLSGVGAMVGAYFGERWDGKISQEAWRVGVASFVGRILGSGFKLLCGFLALVLITVAMVI